MAMESICLLIGEPTTDWRSIRSIINELEASINKYKEEYALLISEANAIKSDLETVEAKVGTNRVERTILKLSY